MRHQIEVCNGTNTYESDCAAYDKLRILNVQLKGTGDKSHVEGVWEGVEGVGWGG